MSGLYRVEEASRLDVYLASLPLELSRSRAQKLIEEGLVRVLREGRELELKPSLRLRPGDVVEVAALPPPPLPSAVPEDIPLPVLYEDEEILVLSKPRGMVVHPAPGHPRGTLLNALLGRVGSLPGQEPLRAGIVHRLDRDTTGVMVVAKTERSYRELQEQIRRREARRVYLALVAGHPPAEGVIEAPLGRHPRRRVKMAVVAGGRPARTRYRVRRYFRSHSLVEATLDTGRTHQIRVHFQYLGHPVVADPLYGGKRGELGFPAQALHAWRLSFRHPTSGERLEFMAPLPQDWREALLRLKREVRAEGAPSGAGKKRSLPRSGGSL